MAAPKPSGHRTAAIEGTLQNQQLARLGHIRDELARTKTLGKDRDYVFQVAVEGDMTASGIALPMLHLALDLHDVKRSDVLTAFEDRLAASRGMAALLTMRDLESIVIPGAHPSAAARDDTVSVIRKYKETGSFGQEETQLVKKLTASGSKNDFVTLVELLLSKDAPSQVQWVEDTLGPYSTSTDPEIRELTRLALKVMQRRGQTRPVTTS